MPTARPSSHYPELEAKLRPSPVAFYGSIVGISLVAFFVLTLIFGAWYTIDQGERGVLTTNGAFTATVDPGLHFKWPIVQGVTTYTNRQQVSRFDCTGNTCPADHAYVMQGYSRDQQPADLRVSVNWHIPPDRVAEVYTNYGNIDTLASRTVWRITPQEVKTVFGQYDAVTVIQNRAQFNLDVTRALEKAMTGPVVIDGVQVENIDFSNAYEQAVEARMQAQVEVQRQLQTLERERINAEIAVTQAKGRADSVKAEADATAYKLKTEGEASAAAIKARAAALADNPLLVEQTKSERWNGVLPTTMLPNATVPFFNTDSRTVAPTATQR